MQQTYELTGNAIKCLVCQHLSYNKNDISHKYCAFCEMFHEGNDSFKEIAVNRWFEVAKKKPMDSLDVLVTDGKEVWIGDYNSKRRESDCRWAVVYDGAPPFGSEQITHWRHKPLLPDI